MGYYASGDGYIDYEYVLTEEAYNKAKDALMYAFGDGGVDGVREWHHNDACITTFNFWSSDKYYEYEVIDALNEAARIGTICEGELRYAGEDDTYWRFVYNGTEWVEESGVVKYDSETKIDLPNGRFLAVELSYDPAYPYEIYVGLEDDEGAWFQDLATVGVAYKYDEDGNVCYQSDISVKVYADKNTEDYTNEFKIGIRDNFEEENDS